MILSSAGDGNNARLLGARDGLELDLGKDALGECALDVGLGDGDLELRVLNLAGCHGDLVSSDAAEAPEERRQKVERRASDL